MGRKRERVDPDRFIAERNGNYSYKRRVPIHVAHLDGRSPHVRMTLKTDDITVARKKRDMLEAADDALWASMTVDDPIDPARRAYDAAVKRVEALDFTFHPARELVAMQNYDDLRRRYLEVDASASKEVPQAMLGAVAVPLTTIRQAFDIYCDEIVRDELVSKSKAQRDQWKKVKLRAVNNFIELVSDKPMADITIDDAKKVYRHWLDRIAPKPTKDGAKPDAKDKAGKPASHSSGNRDLGNLRVLYAAYFRHMGDARRDNPFDGLGFARKNMRSRPPIPTSWLRDTIMGVGRLATLNEQARGILLAMIETGARPSEIANLAESDIRMSHHVPHIAIQPRIDPLNPREIKTASSKRDIPLVGVSLAVFERHRDGFPQYRDRENDLSATLNSYMRENDLLPTRDHTLYSFRHSFEDRMKEGGLDEELRRILMGHTIARPRYGAGGSLKWRRDELMRIVLPFDRQIV